jgi:hypothetical protein
MSSQAFSILRAGNVRFPIFVLILLVASAALAEHPPTSPEQGRSRLLELFIWKTSEELKLPTDVENKFGEIVRHLNEKRKANGERMEKAIVRLDQLTQSQSTTEASTSPTPGATKPDAKVLDAALTEYRKALQEYQKLQTDELTQLKAILPPDKLARYLVVKNELTEKLKTFLSKPNEAPATDKNGKPLAAPKVIEEK